MIGKLLARRQKPGNLPSVETAVQPPSRDWQVLGAAVTGVSHRRTGLACQDAVDFRTLPGGALLIAQADGAGSAARSEQGARWAVAEALHALEAGLRKCPPGDPAGWEGLLRGAFEAASRSLHQLADADCEPVRAFDTTLSCVACLDGWLAAGQVGDGLVVARDSYGGLSAVTRPQKGEYANETTFLTRPEALETLEIQVTGQPVSALAVMSDGLVRLAMSFPSGIPHEPFFDPLFAFAASAEDPSLASSRLADFLDSERVSARTDDDKSLVIAVRRGSVHGQPPGGHSRNRP